MDIHGVYTPRHVSNPFIAGQGSSVVADGSPTRKSPGFKPLHSGAGFLRCAEHLCEHYTHRVSNPFIAGQGSSDMMWLGAVVTCGTFQTPS